jgi:hypothetical protein
MTQFYQPTPKEIAQLKSHFTLTNGTLYRDGEKITHHHTRALGKRILNTKVIIGALTGNPPKRQKGWSNPSKMTHCDICGGELPEEELRMQAANHRNCWEKMIQAGWSAEDEAEARK